ncbi:hypothetical protein D3C87_1205710 [compost metagenome]
MLRTIMAEIFVLVAAKHHAVVAKQASLYDLLALGPAGGAERLDVLGLARPPDRHEDGDRDSDQTTGCGDGSAFEKDMRCIGVVEIPPPEQGRRWIDLQAGKLEPWLPKLRLIAEPPRDPLRRAPYCNEHDQEDDDNLSPEHARR